MAVETRKGVMDGLPETLRVDLNRSVIEGGLNTVFGTLIGGTYLVGFALALGATDAHIGILSALPPLLNLVQVLGSYLVSRVGSSKAVCVASAGLYRIVWLAILALPWFLLNSSGHSTGVLLLVAALGLASLFASLSGVAWMSWIADLVPQSIRGRFFGYRNMVAGAAGMVAALLAGQFIDFWEKAFPDGPQRMYGFSILFAVGIAFGVYGWIILNKISDQPVMAKKENESFFSQLGEPFRDAGFRKWTVFSAMWGLAVGVGSPFFSVYMLKTLELPFALIAVFGVVSGVTNIIGMRVWGNLIDDVGSKPLLMMCSIGGATLPLMWLLATKGSYEILWVINILSGFVWSGIGLASSHLLMSAAPKERASTYFAVFSGVSGLAGAIAPLLGGLLAAVFAQSQWQLGGVPVSGLQFVFVITAIMRLSTLTLLRSVPAPGEMSAVDVLTKLGGLSRFHVMRTGQQFATIGVQSLENTLGYISTGSLQMERTMSRIVNQGAKVAHALQDKSHDADHRIEERMHRWEARLDVVVQPLAKGARSVYEFLKNSEEDER